MSTDQPLLTTYDDRFITISSTPPTLTLKRYHRSKSTFDVHIPTLLYIRPASDVIKRIGLRPHGLSLRGIVWASTLVGPRSGYKNTFIIKGRGDTLRRGFSVEDPERFLGVLEQLCPGLTRTAMGEQEEAEIKSETERESNEAARNEDRPKSFFEM